LTANGFLSGLASVERDGSNGEEMQLGNVLGSPHFFSIAHSKWGFGMIE